MSEAFEGLVGRTLAESVPWWEEAITPPHHAPSLVVVVLDDVGFAHLGCYGSNIRTPRIDALAQDGLRYTNFHTTALCSPTRACLLTGRNHHSVGMGSLASWNLGFPGQRGAVTQRAATLAEMLRGSGYNTLAVGKWHLTPTAEQTPAGPYDQWPLQRGFERYYGFLDAATSQWSPELTYDNHRIETPQRPGYHLTEDLVDRAIGFVTDQVSSAPEKPFFLYLALAATHEPHHAPLAYIEKYNGVFDRGWDECRAEWLARQKAMGIVPSGTVLPPRNPDVQPWATLSREERRLYARLQQAMAGMLDHADEHIGRLLDCLRRIGRYDDTLFLLVSDNGASQEGSPVGTLNTIRYHNYIADELDENLRRYHEIGGPRGYNNYPLGWAMAGNTPCRWYKQNTHGGGIRDPLIIAWPARCTDGGGIRHQFHHATDIVPTVLELTGVDAPAFLSGVAQMPIEGTSMAYTFDGPEVGTRKRVQYFEMFGHRGIWMDGWKAVTRHTPGTPFSADRWELYHLDSDFTESNDVAAVEPQRLEALVERWWVEAGKYGVLPLDDRQFERQDVPPPPGTMRARRMFVLLPGLPHIGPDAAPDTRRVSHSISADISRTDVSSEGVLFAFGGYSGGYSLYVKNQQLIYDYNYVGTHFRVVYSGPLPIGPMRVGLTFKKVGSVAGDVRLYVDGMQVAQGHVPRTLPYALSLEGMDVGCDRLTPVGDDYSSPFPFTGVLDRVIVEIGDDRDSDAGGEFRSLVAKQ